MIQLMINGVSEKYQANNLQQLLTILKKDNAMFAVAVNEMFIAKANYSNTELKNGDQIELVMPMQGG